MPKKLFRIEQHSSIDKSFKITGPLGLEVDNDDVDVDEQALLSRQVVRVLNEHWEDSEYGDFRTRYEKFLKRRNK